MNENTARFLVDGTAALDSSVSYRQGIATIIKFPNRASHVVKPSDAHQERLVPSIEKSASIAESIRLRVRDVLEASEMYCSMKYEDVRGCAYKMFTRTSIGALVLSGSAVAAIALFFGA